MFRQMGLATTGLAVLFMSVGVASALTTISNGIYAVHIADSNGDGSTGSWNAVTGAGHPTGAGNNLLYSGLTVKYELLFVAGIRGRRGDGLLVRGGRLVIGIGSIPPN